MRRAALALVVAVLTAGCGMVANISRERRGFGDTCTEVVKLAPPGELKIDSATTRDVDVRHLVAAVTATRRDLAADPGVAAECDFTDGILSGFRWTKGGPPK